MSSRLRILYETSGAFAEELQHGTQAEQKARGVLLALRAAIHNRTLDSLVDAIKPWMEAEVTRELPPQPEPEGPFTVAAQFDLEVEA